MLNQLTIRAILMTLEGTTIAEAVRWVTRRLPAGLRGYYTRAIARQAMSLVRMGTCCK